MKRNKLFVSLHLVIPLLFAALLFSSCTTSSSIPLDPRQWQHEDQWKKGDIRLLTTSFPEEIQYEGTTHLSFHAIETFQNRERICVVVVCNRDLAKCANLAPNMRVKLKAYLAINPVKEGETCITTYLAGRLLIPGRG